MLEANIHLTIKKNKNEYVPRLYVTTLAHHILFLSVENSGSLTENSIFLLHKYIMDVDKWIASLKEGNCISESSLKKLCTMAKVSF